MPIKIPNHLPAAVMLREEARLAEQVGDLPGMRRAEAHYRSYRPPKIEPPAPR